MMAAGGADFKNLNGSFTASDTVISVEGLVEAVRVVLDASSSNIQRASADALCESVKQHPNACQYAFSLATLNMPLSARLFGLNILDNYVRTRLVPSNDAVFLREGIWSLLALVVTVRVEERRLMQDKVAMLVAQLALRIWPQYWPDFFDRILELVASTGADLEIGDNMTNGVRTEMGVLMARMVVDEVHPRDDSSTNSSEAKLMWDDARRPELQKALALVLPSMMQRLYSLLSHCGLNWNQAQVKVMQSVLEAVLSSFGSISLWTPLDENLIIPSVLGIIRIAHLNLDIAGSSLDVLVTFAQRAVRTPVEQAILVNLLDAMVDPVRDLLGLYAGIGDESGYELFKRTTDFIVIFCTTHLTQRKGANTPIPKRLDALLDLLLQLSHFRSLLVSSNVGSVWNGMAKSERLMKEPSVISRLPAIFLHALMTLAMDKSVERVKTPYNVDDFEEGDGEADGDFEALFVTFQSRSMELLRAMSMHHPAAFASYCGNALNTFISDLSSSAVTAQSIRQWTALIHATDSVLRSCSNAIELEDVKGQVMQLGSTLCNVSSQTDQMNPELLFAWFLPLRVLLPLLDNTLPVYTTLMQRLFDFAFSDNPPTMASGSMKIAIQSRAATTLLKVCHGKPSLFLPALDYLVSLFHNTMADTRGRRVMTEMLLVVAGCMESPVQRVELVKLVLMPIANSLNTLSAEVSGGNELGWKRLLHLCGLQELFSNEIGDSSSSQAMAFRSGLSGTNNLLYIVLTHLKKLAIAPDIKTLLNQFVPGVAQCLTHFIVAIHACYDQRNFSSNMEKHSMIFPHGDCMNGLSTEKMLDVEAMVEGLEQTMSPNSTNNQNQRLQGWFYMLRVSTYINLALLFPLSPTVMYANGMVERLVRIVGEGHETYSLLHWTILGKHLLAPMIVNAPLDLLRSSNNLKSLLSLFLQSFGVIQLEAGWQRLASSKMDLKEETEYLSLLMTSTSSLLAIIFDILFPISERDKRTDPVLDIALLRDRRFPDPPTSPLPLSLLCDAGISSKILALLAAMLRWRPTLVTSKVCTLLCRWLSYWMRDNTLHDTIFTTILPLLFGIVGDAALSDHHGAVVILLTELYKWNHFFSYQAFEHHLATIPGINHREILQSLQVYYANLTPVAGVKSQRATIKGTLVKALQCAAMVAAGVTTTVPKLNQRLVLLKKLRQEEAIDGADIASLFD